MSVGVGFIFKYQILDAPAEVERGEFASLIISASESRLE